MRNYEEFKTVVLMRLDADIPEPKDIRTEKVMRLNGGPEEAALVMKGGINAAPAVYLERFYKDYENSGDFEAVYRQILELCHGHCLETPIDISAVTDFGRAKDNITVRLINRAANMGMLETMPYIKFLDLAAVFYVVVRDTGEGTMASARVSDSLLRAWGKTVDDIYPLALENTKRLFPVTITDMGSVLGSMLGMPAGTVMPCDDAPPIYVMTNSKGMFGAAAMLFTDKIREAAEEYGCDMFILPSSIHEILLYPAVISTSLEKMTEMVQTVNREEVNPSEILSDHAYVYERETGKIMF